MHSHIVNAFVEAAREVLLAETALRVTFGEAELSDNAYITDEVTVIISLVGDISGTVLYSLAEALALDLVGRQLGEPLARFDNLAQSGIAELGNVITGRASARLSQGGRDVKMSPPTLLLGKGTLLSTLDLPHLGIALDGESGKIRLHLALRDLDARHQDMALLPVHAARR